MYYFLYIFLSYHVYLKGTGKFLHFYIKMLYIYTLTLIYIEEFFLFSAYEKIVFKFYFNIKKLYYITKLLPKGIKYQILL